MLDARSSSKLTIERASPSTESGPNHREGGIHLQRALIKRIRRLERGIALRLGYPIHYLFELYSPFIEGELHGDMLSQIEPVCLEDKVKVRLFGLYRSNLGLTIAKWSFRPAPDIPILRGR